MSTDRPNHARFSGVRNGKVHNNEHNHGEPATTSDRTGPPPTDLKRVF